MSMIIILHEITRNKSFYQWFKLNTNIAALFTILAGTDLEALKTLSSQVAGIMLFNAPLSEKVQSYIFWGSLIGFFIEEIPQFIIQVCELYFYLKNLIKKNFTEYNFKNFRSICKFTVTYDIIGYII
jgi:hypothetical protein